MFTALVEYTDHSFSKGLQKTWFQVFCLFVLIKIAIKPQWMQLLHIYSIGDQQNKMISGLREDNGSCNLKYQGTSEAREDMFRKKKKN